MQIVVGALAGTLGALVIVGIGLGIRRIIRRVRRRNDSAFLEQSQAVVALGFTAAEPPTLPVLRLAPERRITRALERLEGGAMWLVELENDRDEANERWPQRAAAFLHRRADRDALVTPRKGQQRRGGRIEELYDVVGDQSVARDLARVLRHHYPDVWLETGQGVVVVYAADRQGATGGPPPRLTMAQLVAVADAVGAELDQRAD